MFGLLLSLYLRCLILLGIGLKYLCCDGFISPCILGRLSLGGLIFGHFSTTHFETAKRMKINISVRFSPFVYEGLFDFSWISSRSFCVSCGFSLGFLRIGAAFVGCQRWPCGGCVVISLRLDLHV